jgi:hypothetical protein
VLPLAMGGAVGILVAIMGVGGGVIIGSGDDLSDSACRPRW